MTDTKRHLIDHVFKGGRFDDHGVDVAALPDVVAFRELVVETAKELWRRRNPRRQRLPKGFESAILIKFYEVKPSSAALPLYREYSEPPPPLVEVLDMHDEIDDAVDVIAEAVSELASGRELPSKFPLSVVSQLSTWGRTLGPSESIELQRKGNRIATLGKSVRDRTARLADPGVIPTERPFDVTGMVTMARIRNPRMAVALDNGRELEMPFNEADEEKITRALHERTSVHIRVTGTAEFDSAGMLHRPLTVDGVEIVPASPLTGSTSIKPPLWLMIEELMSDVSDDEMAKVPPANSRTIDRKLYGKKAKRPATKK
ncbi:MAG TPA: hypothetical protein VNA69_16015 [Thermoanaerobaculia bacterium]|nr:hypothetical protein [Thermoanaerobaculia bacterium]